VSLVSWLVAVKVNMHIYMFRRKAFLGARA